MEAVGIGDLHLGSNLNKICDFDNLVFLEVGKVLKYASNKGINNVFLYGDISDSPKLSQNAQVLLLNFFLSNQDFNFYIILGNHDKAAEDSSRGHSLQVMKTLSKFKLLKNVRIFEDPKTVNIDGIQVRFLPWPSSDFHSGCLNVSHLEVQGSKYDNGKIHNNKNLSKSKRVVVSGHLHTSQKVRNTYYSGTLYQTNFGEQKLKYFHHIQYSSDSDFDIQLVPHKQELLLETVHVTSTKQLKDLVKSTNPLHKFKIVIDNPNVDLSAMPSNVVKSVPYSPELVSTDSVSMDTDAFFKSWVKSNNGKPSWISLREKLLNNKMQST